VSRPVRVDDPRILVGRVRSGGSETVLFVNCSSETIAAEPILADGVELDLAAEPLTLEPFGVAAISANRRMPATVKREVLGTATAVATGEGRDARV
jgi:hypothetical protein